MLDITGEEISKLNDTDLRTLVGRLCEAEFRFENMPVSGITWGGHQDASDGGIDVRVDLERKLPNTGFIPKSQTGFQVKKPDLSPSQIIEEMCPKGKLRESIAELIKGKGAYIIICGNASTTDLTLKNRKTAMKKAVKDLDKKKSLTLDYYDRDRLATWVRCHPSLIIWVKEKVGTPIYGWQPFRNWSKHNDDIDEEYFVDDKIRIFEKPKAVRLLKKSEGEGITVVDGINLMRKQISSKESSVRFVGLSGYGKTRLLQVLFDNRIGKDSLNQYEVIYGDVVDNLTPDPKTLAQQLVALNQIAILAVDNCPPNLHRQLTKICYANESKVKLITIEYDIQEDEPEQTKTIRLEPVSDDLLKKIISDNFRHINYINIGNIVECSGGNPRIAFALARTVEEGDAIDYLKDNELFNRLFFQRNKLDESLMKSAEACSLVYSFDSTMIEDEDEEMRILSSLAEVSKRQLYRQISILIERDLIQKRSKWRAVLPHAIANKLASRALKNIPITSIINAFEGSSERMLKSFFRRLNFLQNSLEAKELARGWMSKNGMLGNLNSLNTYNLKLLNNIALLAPEYLLETIEKTNSSAKESESIFPKDYQFQFFSKIISAIAYNEEYFERCINLLIQFYFSCDENENKKWMLGLIKSFFQARFSNTHAPFETRLKIVTELIDSESEQDFDLGIELLSFLLKVESLRPFRNNPIFNKYQKDLGISLRSKDDIDNWFLVVLTYCESLILKGGKYQEYTKTLIAKNFKLHCYFIWTPKIFCKLQEIMELCSKEGVWIDGWIAIRETIRFGQKKLDKKQFKELRNLERGLQPKTLIDQARAFALSSDTNSHALMNPEEVDNKNWYENLNKKVKELGKKVSRNESVLNELIQELVTNGQVYRIRGYHFGEGLAKGSKEPIELWGKIKKALAVVPENQKCLHVIHGFLWELSKRDSTLTEQILDDAINDKELAKIFPILQSCVEKDNKGWTRINKSLDFNYAPIFRYGSLLNSNFNEETYQDDLVGFLGKLIKREGGIYIVMTILSLKVFSEDINNSIIPNKNIKAFSRKALTKIVFDKKTDYSRLSDFKLARIIDGSFEEDNSKEGKILCSNIVNASIAYKIYLFDFPNTINSLARQMPVCFLNSFLGDKESYLELYQVGFNDELDSKIDPLSKIDNQIILDWCTESPDIRFPRVAESIKLFSRTNETEPFELTELALILINNASDIKRVLNSFVRFLKPSSWSGKRTDVLRKRMTLLNNFKSHEHKNVREWGKHQEKIILREITDIEKRQIEEYRDRDERFEY